VDLQKDANEQAQMLEQFTDLEESYQIYTEQFLKDTFEE